VQVLNLFLALLLSSFGADKLKMEEKDDEINKIQEAIDRTKRFVKFLALTAYTCLRRKLCGPENTSTEESEHTDLKEKESYEKKVVPNMIIRHSMQNLEIIEDSSILTATNANDTLPKDQSQTRDLSFCVPYERPETVWQNVRCRAFECVEHKYFEFFIIVMIILSSTSLVMKF
jgi:hypothetical protein